MSKLCTKLYQHMCQNCHASPPIHRLKDMYNHSCNICHLKRIMYRLWLILVKANTLISTTRHYQSCVTVSRPNINKYMVNKYRFTLQIYKKCQSPKLMFKIILGRFTQINSLLKKFHVIKFSVIGKNFNLNLHNKQKFNINSKLVINKFIIMNRLLKK